MITSIYNPFLSFFSFERTHVRLYVLWFVPPASYKKPAPNLRMTLSPAEPPTYYRNGESASTRYVYVYREAQWRDGESYIVEFTKIKKSRNSHPVIAYDNPKNNIQFSSATTEPMPGSSSGPTIINKGQKRKAAVQQHQNQHSTSSYNLTRYLQSPNRYERITLALGVYPEVSSYTGRAIQRDTVGTCAQVHVIAR